MWQAQKKSREREKRRRSGYPAGSFPVIAVPTSVGYGANFNGLSSLLCMLNSCASGVVVVNIDNGFGAGYTANSINKLGASKR